MLSSVNHLRFSTKHFAIKY